MISEKTYVAHGKGIDDYLSNVTYDSYRAAIRVLIMFVFSLFPGVPSLACLLLPALQSK
jgi:hypothetical protein